MVWGKNKSVANTKSDKMSIQPKASLGGVHLNKGQPDPKISQTCQPDLKPVPGGYT